MHIKASIQHVYLTHLLVKQKNTLVDDLLGVYIHMRMQRQTLETNAQRITYIYISIIGLG